MSRMIGTVSMGVRAPIIREGDNLVEIVTNCILEAMKEDGLQPRDRDICAMTEAIVARAQGNYCSVDNIADDVRAKLGGETIGVIFRSSAATVSPSACAASPRAPRRSS